MRIKRILKLKLITKRHNEIQRRETSIDKWQEAMQMKERENRDIKREKEKEKKRKRKKYVSNY